MWILTIKTCRTKPKNTEHACVAQHLCVHCEEHVSWPPPAIPLPAHSMCSSLSCTWQCLWPTRKAKQNGVGAQGEGKSTRHRKRTHSFDLPSVCVLLRPAECVHFLCRVLSPTGDGHDAGAHGLGTGRGTPVVRSNLICVTRHCDTVQTPIVREHLLVLVLMKSVWSLGITQFIFRHACTYHTPSARRQSPSLRCLCPVSLHLEVKTGLRVAEAAQLGCRKRLTR